MFVSGGFPWTIVRAEKPRRDRYFAALDKAHTTRTEVEDFARFLREEMSVDWSEARQADASREQNSLAMSKHLALGFAEFAFLLLERHDLSSPVLLRCVKRGELNRALFQHRFVGDRVAAIYGFRAMTDHCHCR